MQHSKGLSIGSPFVLLKKKTPVRMSEGGMWGSSPQLGKPESQKSKVLIFQQFINSVYYHFRPFLALVGENLTSFLFNHLD